jgi:hypothetical protein
VGGPGGWSKLAMPAARGAARGAALLLLLTAVLVPALAVLLALQQQSPPALRLWAVGVQAVEHLLTSAATGTAAAATADARGADHLGIGLQQPQQVVVVLGYKVFGDGVPSPLLHLRLAAGAAALSELAGRGPVKLVLSGGVPPDAPGREGLPSEAAAMHAHMRRCFPAALANRNVSIVLEPAAHSTHENAVNTLVQLLDTGADGSSSSSSSSSGSGAAAGKRRRQQLSLTVATNRYHQLRSLRVFRAAGHRLGLSADSLLLRAAPIPMSLSVAAQRQ